MSFYKKHGFLMLQRRISQNENIYCNLEFTKQLPKYVKPS